MAEVFQRIDRNGPDRGLASSEMAELAVSPADRGLRRWQNAHRLVVQGQFHYGRMKQKVKKEIPVY
jgi:hypothetical protein